MMLALSIVALGFLVLIHEAGHFFAARMFGMRAENFSIGFGPALLTLRGKKTEYRLNMLPLGGYVRIAGMAPGDGSEPDDPASFANKPAWQRFIVIFAGPFINWLFAFLVLVGLATTVGLQELAPGAVIGAVAPGTPAVEAGLIPGDEVVEVDGVPVDSWVRMTEEIRRHPGRPLPMRIERAGRRIGVLAQLGPEARLGVLPATRSVHYGFAEALPRALERTGLVVLNTLDSIGQLVRRTGAARLGGPVEIVSQTVEAAKAGLPALANVLVLISMALAFFNLLPLPALDGGRLIFILLAMVRRRPVDAKVEAVVHAVGFLLLLGLLILVTVGDISRLWKPAATPAPVAPTEQGATPDAGAAPR